MRSPSEFNLHKYMYTYVAIITYCITIHIFIGRNKDVASRRAKTTLLRRRRWWWCDSKNGAWGEEREGGGQLSLILHASISFLPYIMRQVGRRNDTSIYLQGAHGSLLTNMYFVRSYMVLAVKRPLWITLFVRRLSASLYVRYDS